MIKVAADGVKDETMEVKQIAMGLNEVCRYVKGHLFQGGLFALVLYLSIRIKLVFGEGELISTGQRDGGIEAVMFSVVRENRSDDQ
jgi:hypothetical protein